MNAQFHPHSRSSPIFALFNLSFGLFLCFAIVKPCTAFDLWTEQQISSRLTASTGDQIVPLDVGRSNTVFSLLRKSTPTKFKGYVILFHNLGQNADVPLIQYLRRTLPDGGWTTLSVQMPFPDADWQQRPGDDMVDDIRLRINAAIQYLDPEKTKPIVVLAHGMSSLIALTALSGDSPVGGVSALVGISMPHLLPPTTWGNSMPNIEKLKLPMLDVYAEFDLTSVLENAPFRRESAMIAFNLIDAEPKLLYSAKIRNLDRKKRENVWYRQQFIQNADSNFSGELPRLYKAIRGWIDIFVEKQVTN